MREVPESVLKELAALPWKSDEDIDYSDIPDTSDQDWSGSVRGQFYRSERGALTNPIVLSDHDTSLEAFASDDEPNQALRLAARAHLDQPSVETQAELSEACLSVLVQQAQELKMGY